MNETWLRLFLVGVPVIMLLGSWLALKRLTRSGSDSHRQGYRCDDR